MLFHSTQFLFFLIAVFLLYWFVFRKNLKAQNALLLVASYFFYGYWDWRFLILILISSLADFYIGAQLGVENRKSRRTLLLITSLTVNLGFLAFFKYFNFFITSFVDFSNMLGIQPNIHTLKIILPVGISFYTFQTLSYTIDIYRGRLQPTKDILAFMAFVSFFPQLVAGPIERASNLLPQFRKHRTFNYDRAVEGLRRILWGLFLKVVVADNCAETANLIFGQPYDLSGSALFVGAICFSFQIYGDFCGYSEIAIGTARLFGFDLMRNFKFPYFSVNIVEFWRRWHISLSTWFRDYVYIPLGGSYGNILWRSRNVLITFVLSGLWHGANWTFIIWGFLHAMLYIVYFIFSHFGLSFSKPGDKAKEPGWKDIPRILLTFFLVLLLWVFFRAETIEKAWAIVSTILSPSLFVSHNINDSVLVIVIVTVVVEWIQRKKDYVLDTGKLPHFVKWIIYLLICALIFNHWGEEVEFIYFQF